MSGISIYKTRLVIAVTLIWPCLWMTGRAAPPPTPEGIVVNRLQVLEDPEGNLTIDQILERRERFQEVLVKAPNYHYSSSAYWFHLSVENRRQQLTPLYLDVQHMLLDYVTLHIVRTGGRRE